jgi:hypothetical protein
MHHTFAFWENIDAAGLANDLAPAAQEPTLRAQGDRLYVPNLNQIVAIAAMVGSGGNGWARLESPELLKLGRHYIQAINGGNDGDVEPGSPQAVEDRREHPLSLVVGEGLLGTIHSNTTAAADQSIVIFSAAGPLAPQAGPFFTARGTSATAVVAGAWSLCAITLDENLARGRYRIIGLRPQGATCIAARFVLPNQGERPGALGVDVATDIQHMMFRAGGMGSWGEWEDTDALNIEFLCNDADAAETVYIDFQPVRLGPG